MCKQEMEAALQIVKYRNSGQFLLKLGKTFNVIAEKYCLSNEELFSLVFDQALALADLEDGRNSLVTSVKYPEPRVTLFVLRKEAGEDMNVYKQNFVAQAVRYLTSTSKREAKAFDLILCIERES